MADRILGSQFLQDIAEFFLNFQSMYDGFVQRGRVGRAAAARPPHDVRGRHHARRPRRCARPSSSAHELRKRDFHLGALVLNKTLPDYLRGREGAQAAAAAGAPTRRRSPTGSPTLGGALADPTHTARVLRTVGESFENFAVVAKREAELRGELGRRVPRSLIDVPGLEADIHDLGGLAAHRRPPVRA